MTVNPRLTVPLIWLSLTLACDAGSRGNQRPGDRHDPPPKKETQKEIVDNLIAKGLVSQLNSEKSPAELFVTEEFQKNGKEVKEGLLRIVFDYCYGAGKSDQKDAQLLVLYDSQSGKKVGEYGKAGLKAE